MGYKIISLDIPDIKLIESQIHTDQRRFFLEKFKASVLKQIGLPSKFVQDNIAYSVQGVLQWLHFQSDSLAQSIGLFQQSCGCSANALLPL